jgi:hypothetical protein
LSNIAPFCHGSRLDVANKGALHTTGVVDALTDHPGNVCATVSDLRTITDYYPFGKRQLSVRDNYRRRKELLR